jgi:hypothetical protein
MAGDIDGDTARGDYHYPIRSMLCFALKEFTVNCPPKRQTPEQSGTGIVRQRMIEPTLIIRLKLREQCD